MRSRLLPIAHARKKGKEQKNQGLYFDYEPVDAKAAEEVPIEKGRLVTHKRCHQAAGRGKGF